MIHDKIGVAKRGEEVFVGLAIVQLVATVQAVVTISCFLRSWRINRYVLFQHFTMIVNIEHKFYPFYPFYVVQF